jgi:hypothetical protein
MPRIRETPPRVKGLRNLTKVWGSGDATNRVCATLFATAEAS